MSPSSNHRMYYVALLCPPEIDREVSSLKQYMRQQYGCVAALKSPAHITLVAPFWYEEPREEQLLSLLGGFHSDVGNLDLHLQGFSHFDRKVLFIAVDPSPALEELRNQAFRHFHQALGPALRPDDRPFHPHVTIATRDLRPSAFVAAWEYFSRQTFEARFTGARISLLKLFPGQWQVIRDQAW